MDQPSLSWSNKTMYGVRRNIRTRFMLMACLIFGVTAMAMILRVRHCSEHCTCFSFMWSSQQPREVGALITAHFMNGKN